MDLKFDYSIQDTIGFYDTDLYNFNTREEFCKAENTISNTMVLTIQNSDIRIKVSTVCPRSIDPVHMVS